MTSIRQKIPHRFIIEKDEYYINLFLKELENLPNIYILHDKLLKNKVHVPVFSFMISFGDKFLHPNYICALLNDLFGIQSRPGCSCAPNYGRFLLGYNKVENDYQILESLIIEGFEIFRPGYLRLNLPYFYPQFIIEYVIKAIKFICQNGHLLLGLYYYDITSGKFWHYGNQGISQTLNFFDFSSNSIGKEDLYRPPNLNVVSSKDLDKIYDEVERYVSSYNFLKKTFFLRNNEPITRRNDYQRFGEKEKSRWFCVFKDVEPLLKKLNLLVVNSMDENSDNEYKKLIEDFEAKTRQKKRDWAIQYQNVDLRRSTVIY